jgi:hypothetical protein
MPIGVVRSDDAMPPEIAEAAARVQEWRTAHYEAQQFGIVLARDETMRRAEKEINSENYDAVVLRAWGESSIYLCRSPKVLYINGDDLGPERVNQLMHSIDERFPYQLDDDE